MNKSMIIGLNALIKFSIGTITKGLGALGIPGTIVGFVACGVGVGIGSNGFVIKLFGRTEAVGVGVGVGVGVVPPPPSEVGVTAGTVVVAVELAGLDEPTELIAIT